jgi:hypothetical protein
LESRLPSTACQLDWRSRTCPIFDVKISQQKEREIAFLHPNAYVFCKNMLREKALSRSAEKRAETAKASQRSSARMKCAIMFTACREALKETTWLGRTRGMAHLCASGNLNRRIARSPPRIALESINGIAIRASIRLQQSYLCFSPLTGARHWLALRAERCRNRPRRPRHISSARRMTRTPGGR